jgi:hypothetical protein
MKITIDLPDNLPLSETTIRTELAIVLFQQQTLPTLQDPDPTVCQTAAIAIDHLETRLLETLESPATPITQIDWAYIRATVHQNLSQNLPNP